MAIKPQSIRKGVIIKFDNIEVDKQIVITASETWSPNHEILFKKLLQQGGMFNINGVKVEVIPAMKVVNSQGNSEIKASPYDPLARF
jgi:phage baseplate assembly protein gpV